MTVSNNVLSLQRGIALLKCFSVQNKKLRLNELVAMSRLPKTTAIRLLATLQNEGLIIRDGDKKYSLAIEIFRMGNLVQSQMPLKNIGITFLQRLNEKTGETTALNVYMELSRVCLARIESPHSLRTVIEVGRKYPLHVGASGTLLLSYQSEDVVKLVFLQHKKMLQCSFKEFYERLLVIKAKGYAISHGEREAGVSCISVPVFDEQKRMIAGLNVVGPSIRFDASCEKKYLEAALETAQKINKKICALRYIHSHRSIKDK